METIEEEKEVAPAEQPSFGLGLKKKMITRSNSSLTNQEWEFTPAPASRHPRIISQEALNAFAYAAMSNPPLYSSARANIPPPLYDPINLEHFCCVPVIHPTTGKIYQNIRNSPMTQK